MKWAAGISGNSLLAQGSSRCILREGKIQTNANSK